MKKIPTKTCHIMDALHRSTSVDFRLTCFSILRFFCDLLRIFKVSVDMILPLKSIGKNLYEKILTKTCHIWMHCIDLLMRISDQLDFLIYDFFIYYAILKFQLFYFFYKKEI
jgi:hypothetical protein